MTGVDAESPHLSDLVLSVRCEYDDHSHLSQ